MAKLVITQNRRSRFSVDAVAKEIAASPTEGECLPQSLWSAFDAFVRQPFLARVPIDEDNTSFPLIFETEFCHLGGHWGSCSHSSSNNPLEHALLYDVECFFEALSGNGMYRLAGIEEPRSAARKFSAVKRFTLGDDIKIDVKNGFLYVKDRATGEWILIFSELLICHSKEFGALSNLLNDVPSTGQTAADATSNTLVRPDDNDKCPVQVRWFIQEMGRTDQERYDALTRNNVPHTFWSRKIRAEFNNRKPNGPESSSAEYKEFLKQLHALKRRLTAP